MTKQTVTGDTTHRKLPLHSKFLPSRKLKLIWHNPNQMSFGSDGKNDTKSTGVSKNSVPGDRPQTRALEVMPVRCVHSLSFTDPVKSHTKWFRLQRDK